jgi:hypothetical protein
MNNGSFYRSRAGAQIEIGGMSNGLGVPQMTGISSAARSGRVRYEVAAAYKATIPLEHISCRTLFHRPTIGMNWK